MVDSGKPSETTGEMVTQVKTYKDYHSQRFEQILGSQENITRNILTALNKRQKLEFSQLIKQGEKNLEQIGAVSDATKAFIRKIEAFGGAAKICGAGGQKSGSGVILVIYDKLGQVEKLVTQFGYSLIPATLGGEGIRLDL